MLATRYIKIHCAFDDRNPDRTVADRAEFVNASGMLVRIYQRIGWRKEYYQYDAMGNRTRETIITQSEESRDSIYYANSNRLAANGKHGYVYDENGNLIAKSNRYMIQGNPLRINDRLEIAEGRLTLLTSGVGVIAWEYDYDLMNRMTAVRKNGETVAEYVYDPTGLIIEKKGTQGTIRYVFNLSGEVIVKYDQAKNKESRYIYVFGKTFAREDKLPDGSKKKIYYHTDIQGNIMQATDEQGADPKVASCCHLSRHQAVADLVLSYISVDAFNGTLFGVY